MASRVCIVDDDSFYGEILCNLLTMQGFEPLLFTSATECLDSLATDNRPEPYDAFILDVVMPDMDGYSLCANLRKRSRFATTPVLFVSSKYSLEDRMRGYESGGNDYLGKPVQPDELKVKLEQAIANARAQKALAAQQTTDMPVLPDQAQYARQLINFLERSEQISQSHKLADALLSCLSVLGLAASVMIRYDGQRVFVSADGSEHAIEKELLELSVEKNTEIEFNQRLIVNYPFISLLVRRLPEDASGAQSALRQQILALVKIASSRLEQIWKAQQARSQRQYWLELLVSAEKSLDYSTAHAFYKENTIHEILQEFLIALNEGLLDLALDKDQETMLKDLYRQQTDKLAKTLKDYGEHIEEVRHPFQELIEKLKRGTV